MPIRDIVTSCLFMRHEPNGVGKIVFMPWDKTRQDKVGARRSAKTTFW